MLLKQMPSNFLLLLLLLLIDDRTFAAVNKCHSSLLDSCFCGPVYYERHERFVVNCTNTGFKNTDMLATLPDETEVLIFTGNQIAELPWNIFGSYVNLSNLKVIDMSSNGIRDIKGKSYHHVPNVQRLILNHNNLSISSDADDGNFHHPRVFSNFVNLQELHLTNAFEDNTDAKLANDLHDIFVNSNLTKLFRLHLEQNEIKTFKDRNVFCDLPNLEQLYLGDNFLPGLNFNVNCLRKLEFLDLEANNITKFTMAELNALDRLSYPFANKSLIIDVSRNKFRCDASITKFYVWMHETNVTIRNRDRLQCYRNKYGNEYIFDLKGLVEARNTKFNNAIVVLLVILVMILISLLGVYAFLIRDKLRTKLNPLLDVVTRKVHYTTIESQDV